MLWLTGCGGRSGVAHIGAGQAIRQEQSAACAVGAFTMQAAAGLGCLLDDLGQLDRVWNTFTTWRTVVHGGVGCSRASGRGIAELHGRLRIGAGTHAQRVKAVAGTVRETKHKRPTVREGCVGGKRRHVGCSIDAYAGHSNHRDARHMRLPLVSCSGSCSRRWNCWEQPMRCWQAWDWDRQL